MSGGRCPGCGCLVDELEPCGECGTPVCDFCAEDIPLPCCGGDA